MSATRKRTYSLKRTDQLSKHRRNPDYAALNTAVDEICRKENRDTLNFWVSVEAEMRRFNLSNSLSVAAVINEGYQRGTKAIDSGKTIHKPFAWMRLTCRHIIREHQRSYTRNLSFDRIEALLCEEDDSYVSDDEGDDGIRSKLKQAFSLLSHLEQTIIALKVMEKKKWREVQQELQQRGLGAFSLDALRKRKERALKQLRQYLADTI